MLARLGIGEIVVIGLVAFLIFGPQKLPELGKSLGETVRNFKSAMTETVIKTVDDKRNSTENSDDNSEETMDTNQ